MEGREVACFGAYHVMCIFPLTSSLLLLAAMDPTYAPLDEAKVLGTERGELGDSTKGAVVEPTGTIQHIAQHADGVPSAIELNTKLTSKHEQK